MYILGILAGSLLFGEVFPLVKDLYFATPMGDLTLPRLLNVPYGFLVFLVVFMAIGGFAGATWVERWMAARKEAAEQ